MSSINSSQRVVALMLDAFRILVGGFLIGFFLPLIAAYLNGVLYDKDVRTKLENDKSLQVSELLRRQTDSMAILSQTLREIDSVLLTSKFNSLENEKLENALRYREYIKQQLEGKRPALRIGGFYLGSTMLLWPMTLTFLGWLVFLLKPKVDPNDNVDFWKRFFLFWGLLLTYRVPVWMRNLVFSGGDRKYYGHANFDIDFLGFVVQELQCVCIVILLVIVWVNWVKNYTLVSRKTNINQVRNPVREVFDKDRIDQITGVFLHWQVSSLLLVGAFIGWSYYYWDMVFVIGDKRYLMSAIIVHMIWLSTWLIISLPLFSAWHSWQKLKLRAIGTYLSQNGRNTNSPVAEDFIKAINELHPVGFWNAAASGIGVAISLLTPILQAVTNS